MKNLTGPNDLCNVTLKRMLKMIILRNLRNNVVSLVKDFRVLLASVELPLAAKTK